MLIRLLALIAGLAPIVAIHAALLIAIAAERVPACIPYVDGCTSISGAGRYEPASYLFKGVMLPQSLLIAGFWIACVAWLRALERSAGDSGRSGTVIGTMGAGGALCLILYVTFLGSEEPFYEFMRRFGVYLYFLFNVLAQIGMAWKVRRLAPMLRDRYLRTLTNWQLFLGVVPFLLGALNLVLKATLADPDAAENIIEWIFALLMQVWFLLAWLAWRHTDFTAQASVRPVVAQKS